MSPDKKRPSERVQSLLHSNARNARWKNCKLVLRQRSQLFRSRRFFSRQAKLRSTTQRFGMTLKVCSSLRLAIRTVMWWSDLKRHNDWFSRTQMVTEVNNQKSRRTFDASFKLKVAQMVRIQGLSIGQVCKDMKLGESAVRR